MLLASQEIASYCQEVKIIICQKETQRSQQRISAPSSTGVTGFDSRQNSIVSMSSLVWGLVKLNAQAINGNNNYALAA